MINDTVDPFITSYRDSLDRQKDLANQNLDNQRRNDYASIMGSANTAGMMYSNFPERSKIQYDTQTYIPNQTKIQNTYQTGLDKLRTNVVNLSNQLKNINDAISDLNKTNVNGNGDNTPVSNVYGIDDKLSKTGQIYYKNNGTGASVRFGTYAKERGGDYKSLLQEAAKRGDNDSKIVLGYLEEHPDAVIGYMGGQGKTTYPGNSALEQSLNRLGITVGDIAN